MDNLVEVTISFQGFALYSGQLNQNYSSFPRVCALQWTTRSKLLFLSKGLRSTVDNLVEITLYFQGFALYSGQLSRNTISFQGFVLYSWQLSRNYYFFPRVCALQWTTWSKLLFLSKGLRSSVDNSVEITINFQGFALYSGQLGRNYYFFPRVCTQQ